MDGRDKDDVYAGRGANNLIGYGGNTSVDRFSGGGNDTVQSGDVPAGKAVVRCEVGTDTVYADKANVVSDDCERVKA